MDATHLFGFCLTGLSAVLLAFHWQTWRSLSAVRDDSRRHALLRQQLHRRIKASVLIGIIGMALTIAELIPHTSWALTAYLFGLVFMACWLLKIAVADIAWIHDQQQREDLERLKKSGKGP